MYVSSALRPVILRTNTSSSCDTLRDSPDLVAVGSVTISTCMSSMKHVFTLLAAGSFLFLLNCDSFDAAVDCQNICKKANDCFGDVDVDDCASTCRGKADGNDSFKDKLDACDTCLDGQACSEVSGCTSECAEVLLRSTL